jgi:hypothetical protein
LVLDEFVVRLDAVLTAGCDRMEGRGHRGRGRFDGLLGCEVRRPESGGQQVVAYPAFARLDRGPAGGPAAVQ